MTLEIDGPENVFKPCAEPDPTTRGPCAEVFPVNIAQSHSTWMAEQAFFAWQEPGGYPWTRLGYTFNWNPQADSIVGVSEYIIAKGTTASMLCKQPAHEFCFKP